MFYLFFALRSIFALITRFYSMFFCVVDMLAQQKQEEDNDEFVDWNVDGMFCIFLYCFATKVYITNLGRKFIFASD